jgi:YHS domain-containing protein
MGRLATTNKEIIDPVCGMEVEPGRTRLVAVYQGHSYWFCTIACREAFEKNPQKYLEPKHPKRKRWWGRYLDRLSKTNKEKFGCGAPNATER